eukprot:gene32339-39927_t
METQLNALIDAVRQAGADGRLLRLRGGGSKDFWGQSLTGEVLDTRAYAGIVSYEPSELVVTVRCGTPLAELEAALAERLASLGGLVAGVAHEINTPVGIALTSASILSEATEKVHQSVAEGAIKKSDILKYLETAGESTKLIMNNAYRAAHLIHSFKQIAVDQVSEVRRRFELREYIGEVVSSLQPKLKKTHIQVDINCPVEIVLDSYPGALAQVITNLTLNCVEHAFEPEAEGHIAINVKLDGDWVEMQVVDNGKGIPPDMLDKVFDPFVTTRRGQGGTGLGLNIVFNLIAKQFAGTITVTSTLGQGASFVLRIPRVTPIEGEDSGRPHADAPLHA